MNLLKSALSDVIKSTDGPSRSETSLHPLFGFLPQKLDNFFLLLSQSLLSNVDFNFLFYSDFIRLKI